MTEDGQVRFRLSKGAEAGRFPPVFDPPQRMNRKPDFLDIDTDTITGWVGKNFANGVYFSSNKRTTVPVGHFLYCDDLRAGIKP